MSGFIVVGATKMSLFFHVYVYSHLSYMIQNASKLTFLALLDDSLD